MEQLVDTFKLRKFIRDMEQENRHQQPLSVEDIMTLMRGTDDPVLMLKLSQLLKICYEEDIGINQ